MPKTSEQSSSRRRVAAPNRPAAAPGAVAASSSSASAAADAERVLMLDASCRVGGWAVLPHRRVAIAFVGDGQPDFEYLTRPDKIYFKVPIPRRAMNRNASRRLLRQVEKNPSVSLAYPTWANLTPTPRPHTPCLSAVRPAARFDSKSRHHSSVSTASAPRFRVDHEILLHTCPWVSGRSP